MFNNKSPKPRPCKGPKCDKLTTNRPMLCGYDCGMALHKENQIKKRAKLVKEVTKELNKEHREKKKQLNWKKTRQRALKEICHTYIKLRDKNELCICCGKALGDDFHAGHFLESGNHSSIRYDEDNIHGQRSHCNMYKGGNSGEYDPRLRLKIGDARVNRLYSIKSAKNPFTTEQDYLDKEAYYKSKIKQLEALNLD